jgi:nitronate monooxygenase
MAIGERIKEFCERFGLKTPILLAPMSGASAPALSIAVMESGGLGACGALLMTPLEIGDWASQVTAGSGGPFQLNLWVPDPAPERDADHEARVREFLALWGPPVEPAAGDARPPDFEAQCQALLDVHPPVVSSVMGLFPAYFVARLKAARIAWFANVTTLAEAKAAEAAAGRAEREMVGLAALIPAVVDAVRAPVVATGGIGDGRGVAAALALGASAAQVGTAFLRTPEAQIHPAWAQALAGVAPEDTVVSRVFSGRAGRSLATDYVRAATARDGPMPAPYPVQRGLTAAMRAEAGRIGDVQRLQAWAGQSAALARAEPAGKVVERLWAGAAEILGLPA